MNGTAGRNVHVGLVERGEMRPRHAFRIVASCRTLSSGNTGMIEFTWEQKFYLQVACAL